MCIVSLRSVLNTGISIAYWKEKVQWDVFINMVTGKRRNRPIHFRYRYLKQCYTTVLKVRTSGKPSETKPYLDKSLTFTVTNSHFHPTKGGSSNGSMRALVRLSGSREWSKTSRRRGSWRRPPAPSAGEGLRPSCFSGSPTEVLMDWGSWWSCRCPGPLHRCCGWAPPRPGALRLRRTPLVRGILLCPEDCPLSLAQGFLRRAKAGWNSHHRNLETRYAEGATSMLRQSSCFANYFLGDIFFLFF